MSQSFDPYHTWLGIPANEQPPNHYRLLGLRLFEPDPDVIQNAMDQRMAHLKTLATGPHVALSQRLLNEVSKAGVYLLQPAKRSTYDAQLLAALGAGQQSATAQPPVQAPPVAPPQQFDPLNAISVPSVTTQLRKRRGKKRKRSKPLAVEMIQCALGGTIGLAAVWFVLFLVDPKHAMVVPVVNFFRPEGVEENVDEPSGGNASVGQVFGSE